MPKTWFRVHADGTAAITRNRKMQTLPAQEFKMLVNLWAFACRNDGCLPPIEDISWELHVPAASVLKIVKSLVTKRFIDEVDNVFVIHDWAHHQYEVGESTERVRRFRERKRNADATVTETLHGTAARARASESESESESVSESGFVSSFPNAKIVENRCESDGWEEYLGVFLFAGKALNDADIQDALRNWLSLDVADRILAFQHIQSVARENEAQFVPMPANHLRKKPWTRRGPGRLLPEPRKQSRVEIGQAKAAAEFLAEGGD